MHPRVHPSERKDVRRHGISEFDADGFVARVRAARNRVSLLRAFYARYPCRVGTLHELAASGIALARMAARSPAYDAIGDRLLPVDASGRPRTEAWGAYVRSFEEGRPEDVREEAWLAAHLADMVVVRAEGWLTRFEAEKQAHKGDSSWALLDAHMAATLGTRVHDDVALAGQMAMETAIAKSLWTVIRREMATGMGLVRTYAWAAVRATLHGGPWVPPHLPSDRALVCRLVLTTAKLIRVGRVLRRGYSARRRGSLRPQGAWSLLPSLELALGREALARIHPDVTAMFESMDSFDMTASVHLRGKASRALAWVGTLLVGQGMYEADLEQVPARFRLFQRDDGSIHFVREFWCAEEVRVFDSDFVVRTIDGRQTLVEVFEDIGVAAMMRTDVLEDGGVSMTVVRVFIRGAALSPGPFEVRFETRPSSEGVVEVTGRLTNHGRGPIGRLASWFGIPFAAGEIRYLGTRRRAEPQSD